MYVSKNVVSNNLAGKKWPNFFRQTYSFFADDGDDDDDDSGFERLKWWFDHCRCCLVFFHLQNWYIWRTATAKIWYFQFLLLFNSKFRPKWNFQSRRRQNWVNFFYTFWSKNCFLILAFWHTKYCYSTTPRLAFQRWRHSQVFLFKNVVFGIIERW